MEEGNEVSKLHHLHLQINGGYNYLVLENW